MTRARRGQFPSLREHARLADARRFGPRGVDLPQARKLTGVIVGALRELGGQAERREIIETAVWIGPFNDTQRAEPSHATRANATHPSELHHRLSWA